MKNLQHWLGDKLHVDSLLTDIAEGKLHQSLVGLTGSAKTVMLASMYERSERSLLVVVPNSLHGQKLYDDLLSLETDVYLYLSEERMAANYATTNSALRAERVQMLQRLAEGKRGIYIVPLFALLQPYMSKQLWLASTEHLRVGDDIQLEEWLERLVSIGYTREAMVHAPGQVAVRGGIIDIYPLTEEHPIRIELFDTEVDSLRTFSADDQRTKETVEEVVIPPAFEIGFTKEMRETIIATSKKELNARLEAMKEGEVKDRLQEEISSDLAKWEMGIVPDRWKMYIPYVEKDVYSFLDYVAEDTILCLDEYVRLEESARAFFEEEKEWALQLFEEGRRIGLERLSYTVEELREKWQGIECYFSRFTPKDTIKHVRTYTCKEVPTFHGQMSLLQTEVERWKKEAMNVFLLVSNEEREQQVREILEDYSIEAAIHAKPSEDGVLSIVPGELAEGFELTKERAVVITEAELFASKKRRPKRQKKWSNAERIKSYSEINTGDYVVHIEHGIGRYDGVETLEIAGRPKDYLVIRYKDDDTVYVPVDKIDLVQKYVSSNDRTPKLHKLGGTDWEKTKRNVTAAVQDIADELMKLYAKRESEKGYAFSSDDDAQQAFESLFPYPETDDQLRSIEEIKRDMEKERPMDRLLCGDVGYGKTEVALRAAFKAIRDGKQVAFLVPTTILAQQHYETIVERFAAFEEIRPALLNRFRTPKEQRETLEKLATGEVDIVVGTHRLLSKDVEFFDLGLLIVDEEQRFGVTHKEKIKQMKTNVDVLTLTATPIPRTLHMSMVGVRDLSVIETPPTNRFPVQTYVMEHSWGVVREAIERELARGGQVFYLYNRVEDMAKRVQRIQELVPEARVGYAHGRMTESALEAVIIAFLEGEYDVLVTTTIIETGIDIPNVNTLIVDDADKMGLSQLYQLRGRVGRSNRVAYSYFLYQRDKILTEVAESRLQAIRDFTELGSGFKIAMRDLTIRGAGNLLGAEQHGFIDSVGFDLYSQLLEEAIQERKEGKTKEPELLTEIQLPVHAHIPETYIVDNFQKIQMYKRIQAIRTDEMYNDLIDEMIDRFGDLPYEVELLLRVARLRARASNAQLESIRQKGSTITCQLTAEGTKALNGPKFMQATKSFGRALGFSMDGETLAVTLDERQLGKKNTFDAIEELVDQLNENQEDADDENE